jgi:hypothetical protein
MIRVKIFSDFCGSKGAKEVYERLCDAENLDFYGKDKQVWITEDDDYTHAIIMNKAMPVLKIPKKNVVGLAFEPFEILRITNEFVEYAQQYIGKYFIGDKRGLPEPFIEHFGYMWYSNPKRDIVTKTKLMSIIVSEKHWAPGHAYRHTLIEKIIEANLPIDIYGKGSMKYSHKSNNVKGEFNDAEPYENYMYSICIENFTSNHYFSEKIMSPMLHNCMPIYLGCKQIHEYFDNILLLSGNINDDIQLLVEIFKCSGLFYSKTYTEKNINTVSLLNNIHKIFDS